MASDQEESERRERERVFRDNNVAAPPQLFLSAAAAAVRWVGGGFVVGKICAHFKTAACNERRLRPVFFVWV